MHTSKPEPPKEAPNVNPVQAKGPPTVKVKTPPPQPTNGNTTLKPNHPQKAATGRSSQPIINWFQRKLLVGTGRGKRSENHRAAVEAKARRENRVSSRPSTRIVSSPLPNAAPPNGSTKPGKADSLTGTQRRALSLNGDGLRDLTIIDDDSSSLARESTWYRGSVLEADDDASVRPLPPSSPPSPSPSRSSSSYLSDPRTFKSMAASTKPTTLLSIDINGGGMAHIAQAPPTPSAAMNRFPPHIRNLSSSTSGTTPLNTGTSITFSSVAPAPQAYLNASNSPSNNPNNLNSLQAPLHTTHHPRNNPRPSSPPLDNASVLTLASSAFAVPGLRASAARSATPSHRGVGDSVSHFGTYNDAESASQFILNDDDGLDERDVDASVKALRPRSSRRGSWESEASRWSAKEPSALGPASLIRDRSMRTANSMKTNPLSNEVTEVGDRASALDDELSPRSDRRSVDSSTSSPAVDANSDFHSARDEPNNDEQSKESPPVELAVETPPRVSEEDRKVASDTIPRSSMTPEPPGSFVHPKGASKGTGVSDTLNGGVPKVTAG